MPKLPTSHEVCAGTNLGNFKCQIERRRNNEVYIWMINWIATNNNMTGSYLSKKSHVSHHIIVITACAQNIRLQHEDKRVDAMPLAKQNIQ